MERKIILAKWERQQKKLRVIDFKHLLFSTIDYIKTFQKETEIVKSDPQFPREAQILANIFYSLSERSLLLINQKHKEFNEAYKKYSNLIYSEKDRLKSISIERMIEFGLDPKRREISIMIEGINEYFKELADLMRYITTSSIENVPQGLLYPFNLILKSLFPKCNIFLRQQSKHNYKYGNFIKQLFDPRKQPVFFEHIRSIVETTDFSIAMVAYPKLCDNNYLYNSNIAHEIGHYIDDIDPIFTSTEDFRKKIGLFDFTNGEKKIRNKILRVAYYWYTEFIADIYATLLLGPAYLFSFIEFNLSTGEDTLDEFFLGEFPYPSPRMRFYFILKTLDHEKIDLIKNFNDRRDIHHWFKIISDKLSFIKNITDEEYKFGDNDDDFIAKKSWRINKKRVEKYINEAIFVLKPVFENGRLKNETVLNFDIFNRSLAEKIIKKFNQLVPINEVIKKEKGKIHSNPLSIYLILNFGWMRFFEILKKYDNSDESSQEKELSAIKLLIKRSVEASYIHQQYNVQRERYKEMS
jgi:hypothetical protein